MWYVVSSPSFMEDKERDLTSLPCLSCKLAPCRVIKNCKTKGWHCGLVWDLLSPTMQLWFCGAVGRGGGSDCAGSRGDEERELCFCTDGNQNCAVLEPK